MDLGGVLIPESLVINEKEGTFIGAKGEIFLSGAKLWFSPDGTNVELV